MEVYVLFIEQVDDFETLRQDTFVYAKEEDAKADWNAFVCDETRFLTESRPAYGIAVDDSDSMEFEAYINGEYAGNHTVAYVRKEEVR